MDSLAPSPAYPARLISCKRKGIQQLHVGAKDDMQYPSLQEIKRAIPADCFQAEVATSIYYTVRSYVLAASFFGAACFLRSWLASSGVAVAGVTAVYWFLQGTVFWGIFTLGHDCGHGSFSKHKLLNQILGNILHSSILTPYETWKISHKHHHKNTGNIDKDEIFYPNRGAPNDYWRVRVLVYFLGLGWILYLLVGYSPRNAYHFWPWDPLFRRDARKVCVSLAFYTFFVAVTGLAVAWFGWVAVAVYYLAPLAVFASWLVLTTFLHHNEPGIPWWGGEEWDYVKGNLSSVDRDYGWLVSNLSHQIGTHQVHHLFPIIPHYKLVRATAFFRAQFPHLARVSDTPIWKAFLQSTAIFLKHGHVPTGVQFYRYPTSIHAAATPIVPAEPASAPHVESTEPNTPVGPCLHSHKAA